MTPPPADELLRYYGEAEAASGVGWAHLAAIHAIETRFGRVAGVSPAGVRGPMQFLPSTFAAWGQGGDIDSPRDAILAAGRFLAAHGFAADPDAALFRYNNSQRYVRAVDDYAAVLAADPAAFAGYYHWQVYVDTPFGDVLMPVGYDRPSPLPVGEFLGCRTPFADMRMTARSGERIDQMLALVPADASSDVRAERLSRAFLGTPYGADTLVGSATEPERLVADLERVDCFTLVDYVEALKRSRTRADVVDALATVRYRDGVVGFATRRHFFTDWAATRPALATDVTATLSADAVSVPKVLNQKDAGGVYLPGLPPVPRSVSYIPSARVNDAVLHGLRTGDYVGAYADDGGLDVTHVGIVVVGPDGPVLRNASSLDADEQVVDTPLSTYLRTVPGIVVLRPLS